MSTGVYLHDTPTALRFQVHGPLSAGEAASLEQCFRTASSIRHSRPLLVDLTTVTRIDDAGRRVLQLLSSSGARFIASPATLSLAGEIAGRPAEPMPDPSRPLWLRIACSAMGLAITLLGLPWRCLACMRPSRWRV